MRVANLKPGVSHAIMQTIIDDNLRSVCSISFKENENNKINIYLGVEHTHDFNGINIELTIGSNGAINLQCKECMKLKKHISEVLSKRLGL